MISNTPAGGSFLPFILAITTCSMGKIIKRVEIYVCDSCGTESDTDTLQPVIIKSMASKPGRRYDICQACLDGRVIPALGGAERGSAIRVKNTAAGFEI